MSCKPGSLYKGNARNSFINRVGNVQIFSALASPGTTAYQAGAQLSGCNHRNLQAWHMAGVVL